MWNMLQNGMIREILSVIRSRLTGILLTAIGVTLLIAFDVLSFNRQVSGCTSNYNMWDSVLPLLSVALVLLGILLMIDDEML